MMRFLRSIFGCSRRLQVADALIAQQQAEAAAARATIQQHADATELLMKRLRKDLRRWPH